MNESKKVSGVDYTIVAATGVITFGSAPASGAIVRADYKHDITMRFDVDEMSFEEFSLALFRGGIPLIEVP